jgi:hypothetical protein
VPSIAFHFASREVSTPPEAPHGTDADGLRGVERVPELRLLENGREDETPVRAASRQPPGSPAAGGDAVCQFKRPGSHPVATRTIQLRLEKFTGRVNHRPTGARHHGTSDSARRCRSSSQSLRPRHQFAGGSVEPVLVGEFDPGSGRTLAACLIHASRTRSNRSQDRERPSGERVRNT